MHIHATLHTNGQHSAKYTPADGQKNEMSHLDQRLSIKQKELNAVCIKP